MLTRQPLNELKLHFEYYVHKNKHLPNGCLRCAELSCIEDCLGMGHGQKDIIREYWDAGKKPMKDTDIASLWNKDKSDLLRSLRNGN